MSVLVDEQNQALPIVPNTGNTVQTAAQKARDDIARDQAISLRAIRVALETLAAKVGPAADRFMRGL